jgi:hypothetical protein
MIAMSSQLTTDNDERLEELAERFRAVCESAVDPLEVASALEFDGVSDRVARVGYEVADVFALARLLYGRVRRRPAEPAADDPWQASQPLLHGLLYALPAACFPAAGALLVGPGVLPALVVALLAGWGLSQGLAAVGYLRLGTFGLGQARHVLRAGLACCVIAVAVIMIVTAHVVHARPLVLEFGAGEGVYMLGASVLLVTGSQRWLPAALAPGVTGALVFLAEGKPPALEHQTWAALAATPVLACVMAVACTTDGGPRLGRLLNRAELLGALPAIALGLLAAGLLSFPVVAGASGHGGGNVGALIASVPLALSMGLAEWILLWYRRATRRLLGLTDDPRWFRRRAGLVLLAALARYMSGTLVIISVAIDVAVVSGQVAAGRTMLLSAFGYLLLGTAMFVVLLLQVANVRLVPLVALAVALGAELALRRTGLVVQIAAPAALLVTVTGYALARLGKTVLHA